jgi:hypothetical protein
MVTPKTRAVLGVLPLVCLAACADLWGLQDLSGADDAGMDATMGDDGQEASGGYQPESAADAHLDATIATDAMDAAHEAEAEADSADSMALADVLDATEDADGADGTFDAESGPEAAVDAPADVAHDVAVEAEAGGGAPDAGPDTGCGSLFSPSHCGACTNACNTTTGTPACNGSTCTYTCSPGRADCNVTTAGVNLDGCECATPLCCGTTCETVHKTGLSAPSPTSYDDCNPNGTGQAQAQAACEAFTGSAAACHTSTLGCLCLVVCAQQATSICGMSGGQCYCWQYGGTGAALPTPHAGTVQPGTGSGCTAACGSGSDPTFD